MLEGTPGAEVTVDLAAREVRWDDEVAPFTIDEHTRWRVMEGLDPIDLTLRLGHSITAFERRRPAFRPLTLPARHEPPVPVEPARPVRP